MTITLKTRQNVDPIDTQSKVQTTIDENWNATKKYDVDGIIHSVGKGTIVKYAKQLYNHSFTEGTEQPLEHMPEHFLKHYCHWIPGKAQDTGKVQAGATWTGMTPIRNGEEGRASETWTTDIKCNTDDDTHVTAYCIIVQTKQTHWMEG